MKPTEINPSLRVLAIDDDENILHIVKTCLEMEGCAVETRSNPRVGLEWYAGHWCEVDVVVLDFMMPELNGEAVFERMRKVNPKVNALLLTGCDEAVAQKLFEEGLRGYIQKPFYLKQLVEQVKGAAVAS